jgi:hypothetical protein
MTTFPQVDWNKYPSIKDAGKKRFDGALVMGKKDVESKSPEYQYKLFVIKRDMRNLSESGTAEIKNLDDQYKYFETLKTADGFLQTSDVIGFFQGAWNRLDLFRQEAEKPDERGFLVVEWKDYAKLKDAGMLRQDTGRQAGIKATESKRQEVYGNLMLIKKHMAESVESCNNFIRKLEEQYHYYETLKNVEGFLQTIEFVGYFHGIYDKLWEYKKDAEEPPPGPGPDPDPDPTPKTSPEEDAKKWFDKEWAIHKILEDKWKWLSDIISDAAKQRDRYVEVKPPTSESIYGQAYWKKVWDLGMGLAPEREEDLDRQRREKEEEAKRRDTVTNKWTMIIVIGGLVAVFFGVAIYRQYA